MFGDGLRVLLRPLEIGEEVEGSVIEYISLSHLLSIRLIATRYGGQCPPYKNYKNSSFDRIQIDVHAKNFVEIRRSLLQRFART